VKRLLVAASFVLSLAAVAALVTGVTYGFFSATSPSRSNAFTAGTVSLSSGVSAACSAADLLPDGSIHTCTLTASYSGSSPAYMGLDVLIETQHGSGGFDLYRPSDDPNDLQVTISSSSPSVPSYTLPAASTTCPGTAAAGSTCYELDDELVSTTPFTSSSPVTFTTTLSIPTSSGTNYQGGAAQVILTAHATQSANNPQTGCSAGHVCNSVSWS
jgi:predicted ribosomally synthesized peptide with SipW-like signal peptide